MNFDLSEEQAILQSSVQRYLRERHSRRTAGSTNEIWTGLARLGLMGVSFPEDIGGFDGGPVEAMIVMEALGEALVLEPWLETVVLCGTVLQNAGGPQAMEALYGIATHSHRMALAHWEDSTGNALPFVATRAVPTGNGWRLDGTKAICVGADSAYRIIVSARIEGVDDRTEGISLFLVDPAQHGVHRTALRLIDGRGCADIRLDGVRLAPDALIGETGAGYALLAQAHEAAIAALCAEATGVARRMLEDTLTYVRQRSQFGQSLSRFQVLQHRLVDMAMEVEMASAATLLATLRLSAPEDERTRALSAAKIVVNKALQFVGENAVQLHGAIGLTDELDVSHYFRRASVIRGQLGTAGQHAARYLEVMRGEVAEILPEAVFA